ncbi:hypothetical protein [Nocardioides sp. Leaf374]|uniref:hypothetical protein n=1 Tax=Nocardioides sp. Leaf374 TaxID=2876560 RepID=UPI001E29CEC8|nr:hypothetical protein [Nocardioides sp. Leaf374]
MATRLEKVLLQLEDMYSQRLDKPIAKTLELDAAIRKVDGTSIKGSKAIDGVGESSRKASGDVDGLGRSADGAGKEVDKLSGRLTIARDLLVTLGPAVVPLGAAAVGGLVALTGQFAALAGGVGVTVLAMRGLGDAMKAVEKARLEPTAENLQAMRVEMEKLGPAGAQFVRYLQEIAPQLSELQMAARAGLLPGLEDGIDALLTRGPEVTSIVSQLASAMGELARESGEGLAGDGYTEFFDYLETDAAPTLRDLGESFGNVTEGIANLIVGFAPVARDFSGGMVEMTESFAEWSSQLSENDSFQDFVGYIRESGPLVIDLLGSMVQTVASIVEATAPLGSDVVPVLTMFVDALGAIASSPVGPPLAVAAAALVTFNRAAAIGGSLSTALATNLDRVGIGAERTSGGLDKVAAAARVAGATLAALAVVDSLQTQFEGLDTGLNGVTSQLLDLSNSGAPAKLGGEFDNLGESFARLTDANYAQQFQDQVYESFSFLGSDSRVDEATAQFEAIDAALANIAATGGAPAAGEAFAALARDMGLSSDKTSQLLGMLPQYRDALAGAENSARLAGDAAGELGGDFREAGAGARSAASGAQQFSTALAELNGWLDKRAAVRAYEESLKDFGKGLKNGFGPKDVEQLDATARGIAQVAQAIKSPELREDFLAGARRSLSELAKGAGPQARAEIERLIAKLDDLGLTHPKPKINVDGRAAEAQAARVRRDLEELDGQRANPKADLDPARFFRSSGQVRTDLLWLDGYRALAQMDGDATGARNAAAEAKRAGQSVDGNVFTMYIDTVRRFFGKSAEGNYFPSVAYAMGGLDRPNAHEAELYRGPLTRVWGEPETQGEAYIPLANDHRRGRAKEILNLTANELGGSVVWHATGGLYASQTYSPASGYAAGRPGSQGDEVAEALGGAADKLREFAMGVAGSSRGLRVELSARQKLLEKMLEREEKERDAIKERLDALRQERESIAQTIADRHRSDVFARPDVPGLALPENYSQMSTEALLAFTSAQASVQASLGVTQSPADIFRADIEAAKEEQRQIAQIDRFLGDGALRYLIDNNQVAAAASMSGAELREFNRLYKKREDVLGEAGDSGALAVVGDELKENRKAYDRQTEVVRGVRADLRRVERAIEKADKSNRDGQKQNAQDVGDKVNGAAANGHRRRGHRR